MESRLKHKCGQGGPRSQRRCHSYANRRRARRQRLSRDRRRRRRRWDDDRDRNQRSRVLAGGCRDKNEARRDGVRELSGCVGRDPAGRERRGGGLVRGDHVGRRSP